MADNSHQSAADAAAAVAEAAAAVAQSTGVQQQPDELKMFWTSQREEIQQINDFKNHKLPISRIKKIMKSGRDVRMITGEAPVLIAKACELFIMELTLLAWLQAQECKRRTMRKSDVVDAIRQTEIFDFLVDVISRVEIEEEATGFWPGMVGSTGSGVPNCYPPMEPLAPPMGRPAPPMGQPAPPMGRRAPQIGRRAPPIGPHAPPIGRLAPPMGPPAPPMGRPAPPIGRPAPPMGPRSPPMGRAAPPIGRPAPPMGPRSPPMGRPAPPIGRLAPPMGRPAPSGVMTRRRAMPWVAPSVHFRPSLQAWESLMQSAEDNSSATGRNSGQGKL